MENKTDLRVKFKNSRKLLNIELVSDIITEKIQLHPSFVAAKNVMLYYPLKYEINLLGLLEDKEKNFYFPKVDNNDLLVCPACEDYKLSELKIYEPCSTPVSSDVLDLIIVPALAVDKNNFRLGYGGGFYDRFLSKNRNIQTLTPISKELLVENLPAEDYDIPIDFIVTD